MPKQTIITGEHNEIVNNQSLDSNIYIDYSKNNFPLKRCLISTSYAREPCLV
jgi:hypothetical protein